MERNLIAIPWVVALLFVGGCFGGGSDNRADVIPYEQLARVYATIDGLASSATAELNAGALSVDDAETVFELLDNARQLADTARTFVVTGDNAGALRELNAATAVLTQIEGLLR